MADGDFRKLPDGSYVIDIDDVEYQMEPDDELLLRIKQSGMESGNVNELSNTPFGNKVGVVTQPTAADGREVDSDGVPPRPSWYYGNWPPKNPADEYHDEPWGIYWDGVNKVMTEDRKIQADSKVYSKDEILDEMPPGNEEYSLGPGKGWSWRPITQTDAQKVWEFPGEGIAYAEAHGVSNPVERWVGNGYVIDDASTAEGAGKKYSTPWAAERDKPPGFHVAPFTLNDGTTLYEFVEDEPLAATPEDKAKNFDELVFKTYREKGSAAAMEVDAWRDRMEAPNVSKWDALSFAASITDNGAEMVALADLLLAYVNEPTLADDLRNAAMGIDQKQAESPQPLTDQEKLAGILDGVKAGNSQQTDALNAAGATDPFGTASDLTSGSVPTAGGAAGVPDFASAMAQRAAEDAVTGEVDGVAKDATYQQVFADELARQQARMASNAQVAQDENAGIEFGTVTDAQGNTVETKEQSQYSNIGPVPTSEDLKPGGITTVDTKYNLTPEQYEAQVAQARAGYEAAKASGTNFGTNEAGERVELTEADYIPKRRISTQATVENADRDQLRFAATDYVAPKPKVAATTRKAGVTSKSLGDQIDDARAAQRERDKPVSLTQTNFGSRR